MERLQVYLYPDTHTYKDSKDRTYISVTTLLSKYENKFDDKKWDIARACEKIGKNPRHEKYEKYKGKTAAELVAEWKERGDTAAANGSAKHSYYEDSINEATGFAGYIKSTRPADHKIYTLEEVFESGYGELNITKLPESLKIKYPRIYYALDVLMRNGYWIFAEVCVYLDMPYLISGLIDVIAINKYDKRFIILDWKTNKKPIRFDPGYWDLDRDGNIVGWIKNDDKFKYPISFLDYSIGNKYSLQVSMYAYLAEQQGFTPAALTIFNTPDLYYGDTDRDEENFVFPGNPIVNVHPIIYYKREVINIISDYLLQSGRGTI